MEVRGGEMGRAALAHRVEAASSSLPYTLSKEVLKAIHISWVLMVRRHVWKYIVQVGGWDLDGVGDDSRTYLFL